ncbi:MAG: M48 family metallopeptidase [Pirellulaceae bacterium]|nr:M48 family metallopeptidase [Pirellulaceae bacterium]
MDFFASQELARRNTFRLVVLLIISVVCIIGSIFALVLLGLNIANPAKHILEDPWAIGQILLMTSAAVIVVVGSGMLLKFAELSKGGKVIADLVGGRRLLPNSTHPAERRLLNIVEEMALAAGMPVPPVYVLDNESGINAFAAGQTVNDAIIGVNRGTLEILNRDELQGVIAHEFSHILNGDMRMSLRIIGLLHGIQAIALIGYMLIRSVGHTGGRSSSSDKGDPRIFLLVAGLGLLVIGSLGLFFARLIKASISRQREYLADASSVQFTRNPQGIGGALKMIAAHSDHSRVRSENAEALSHMFFADRLGKMAAGLLATHPPLDKRIKHVEPRFDGNLGEYLKSRAKATAGYETEKEKPKTDHKFFDKFIPGLAKMPGAATMSAPGGLLNPMLIIGAIGSPTDDDIEYSRLVIGQIPDELLEACHDTFLARCVVFASLLDGNPQIRTAQLQSITNLEGEESTRQTEVFLPFLASADIRYRLPIFEILQGTLVGLSDNQYRHFRKTVSELIAADQSVNLFEFFLRHHLVIHLDRHFGHATMKEVKYETVDQVLGEVGYVLSVLAKVGHSDESSARSAYQAGVSSLNASNRPEYVAEGLNIGQLAQAITVLSHASPTLKKDILSSTVVTISHDHRVTVEEAELFRALAESLDCPVPPLMATPTTMA